MGAEISATSTVYDNLTREIVEMLPWRQRVIAIGAWGEWADTIRTGLREYNTQINPNVPDHVYNYDFQRDIGLVNFWYGQLIGSAVIGYEYYAIP